MKSWTDEKSFPVVTLRRLKGPEKDLILAKQESFLAHKLEHVEGKLATRKVGNKSIVATNPSGERKQLTKYVRLS